VFFFQKKGEPKFLCRKWKWQENRREFEVEVVKTIFARSKTILTREPEVFISFVSLYRPKPLGLNFIACYRIEFGIPI
jgi:hypothetical protein